MQYGGSGDIGPLEQILRPEMQVLDAGCGDGKTTELLARKAEVTACDFSREGLLSLQRQRGAVIDANLVECELGHLPFADEKFDVIACIHSLSHLMAGERSAAAGEIVRTMKTGGHVMIEAFRPADIRYGTGKEIEPASFLRGNGIVTHYFEEGEIQRLFKELELVSDLALTRRVSFGPHAGSRSLVRALLRKAGSN